MKVYLLINDFAYELRQDVGIDVFDSYEKAHAKMLEEFEEYKQQYLSDYNEEDLVIEEPTNTGAMLCVDGNYNDKHDEWSIVEKEVL